MIKSLRRNKNKNKKKKCRNGKPNMKVFKRQ